MSVTLHDVLKFSGYGIDNIQNAQWLISINDEYNELYKKAEELIDDCQHENISDEEIEDTATYELNNAQGNNVGLTVTKIKVCDECGKDIKDV